jgi:hypothetical protein
MKPRNDPLLLILLMAACAAPAPSVPPSTEVPPTAEPSAMSLPGQEITPTHIPLTNPTPAAVLELPEPTPTNTPPPAPANLPLERLAILSPGPGSQVTSPFRVIGWGGPSLNERVHLRLLGEDGRLLAQRTTYLQAIPSGTGRFSTELTFEIPGVAEAARLEVSTQDPRTARLAHLSTLDLVVLSAGSALIHPALHGPEQITILSPRDGAVLRGGNFLLRGAAWSNHGSTLAAALFDRDGNTVAFALVPLSAALPGEVGAYEVALAYSIPYEQYGRLAVYEPSPDGNGFLHYTSIEVYLRR